MKNFSLALFLVLTLFAALPVHADIEGAPFIPEIDRRFDAIEQGNHYKYNSYPYGAADGHYTHQLAQASYNYSTVGGAAGTYDLKVALPKNAIIEKTWLDAIKQPYGAANSISFFCQNAGNILATNTSLAVSPDGTIIDGVETGSAANMRVTTAPCDISATLAGTTSSGLVTVYVEYVVHQ